MKNWKISLPVAFAVLSLTILAWNPSLSVAAEDAALFEDSAVDLALLSAETSQQSSLSLECIDCINLGDECSDPPWDEGKTCGHNPKICRCRWCGGFFSCYETTFPLP